MNLLRKILFPFAALYGAITQLRNFLYDHRILKSAHYKVPIIAVGNLSVGGTGKSPQIEYLVRLLHSNYKLATLSRGYKRQSAGFVLAADDATAALIGDEPYQFHKKFPNVLVAVDADRRNGIQKLLEQPEKPEIILLDDAFQHRKVDARFYILLTAYGDLYADDFLLPTGNLRESRRGAKRAEVIIVTKCPPQLSTEEQLKIKLRLKPKAHQSVFFSFISYDTTAYSAAHTKSVAEIKSTEKLLLAGIAKPQPFFDFMQSGNDDDLMEFPDHHNFSAAEITAIIKKANGRMIVTTEKDFVRLEGRIPAAQLFYVPIQSNFIANSEKFDEIVTNYIHATRS